MNDTGATQIILTDRTEAQQFVNIFATDENIANHALASITSILEAVDGAHNYIQEYPHDMPPIDVIPIERQELQP